MATTAGGPPGGATGRGSFYRLRPHGWLGGPMLLYALLRVPAFLEPHWYTDEAGYVTTARGLLQGQVLYSQVWNNKPPLHLWTVALVIQLMGTSEAVLHILPFLTGGLTLLAVAYAGDRLLGRRRTVVALVGLAILLGTPLFDAELLLPESLLIAPVTWAGAILLTRIAAPDTRRWPLWPMAVGALVATGLAYQQTVLAETCAFGLILAIAGRASWRRVVVYAATLGALTAIWLVPAIITAGASKVGYALVGFYVNFTQVAYTGGASDVPVHLLIPAGVLVVLVAAAWLCRRDDDPLWALWVWAGAALLVPAVAREPYAHYLVPSLAPCALAVTSLGLRWPERITVSRRLAEVGLIAAAGLAVWPASVAGMDWLPTQAEPGHTLANYYGGAMSVLTRGRSLITWQDDFDYRVPEDSAVAVWVQDHGLDGVPAVVWSSDAWLYELDNLQLVLPTPPIYNDEVLLGYSGPVAEEVAALGPVLVITEGSARTAYPEIDSVLSSAYQQTDEVGSEIVWVRNDMVASVTGPTGLGSPTG